MISNLLLNVKQNFVLKKQNIKKSLEYVIGYIAKPYRKLYYHSKDMKFDILSVKKRSLDLQDIMNKVDDTMNDFFNSSQEYERVFKVQKIVDDIYPYFKTPRKSILKMPIDRARESVNNKKRLYEQALKEYNNGSNQLLAKNVSFIC